MSHRLPPAIQQDIGSLVTALGELQAVATGSSYYEQAFGNYTIDFTSPRGWFRIVKERSQYYVQAKPAADLGAAGLDRAFDDRAAFASGLQEWVRGSAA